MKQFSEAGQEYRRILRQLDRLIEAGEGEGPEADALRDRMDDVFDAQPLAERILRRDPSCWPASMRTAAKR